MFGKQKKKRDQNLTKMQPNNPEEQKYRTWQLARSGY